MSDRLQPQNIKNVQPQSLEAERSVLGAMLVSKEAVPKAFQWLSEEHFYKQAHSEIFRAMVKLFNDNEPIDTVTIVNRLKKTNHLESCGGAYYITGLVETVPTTANVESYAKIVLNKALLRQLILLTHSMATDAFEDSKELSEVLEAAHKGIFNISQNYLRGGFVSIELGVSSALEELDKRSREKGISGISTGLIDLDKITAGLHKGEMTTIAGDTSMGKTSLGLTITKHVAVKQGIPVGIFSLEMSMRELVLRLMTAEARVDAHKVRTGELSPEDWEKLMGTAGIIAEAPIFIDDTFAMSITSIRAKARRLKTEHNVGLIIVDYIQLLTTEKPENATREIATITRSLKAMSKELDIPVIALSQLSRKEEKKVIQRRPLLVDLKGSSTIEQDSDVVMLLYRLYWYTKKESDRGKAEIIVAKQRNGITGTCYVTFIDKYAKFEDRARGY